MNTSRNLAFIIFTILCISFGSACSDNKITSSTVNGGDGSGDSGNSNTEETVDQPEYSNTPGVNIAATENVAVTDDPETTVTATPTEVASSSLPANIDEETHVPSLPTSAAPPASEDALQSSTAENNTVETESDNNDESSTDTEETDDTDNTVTANCTNPQPEDPDYKNGVYDMDCDGMYGGTFATGVFASAQASPDGDGSWKAPFSLQQAIIYIQSEYSAPNVRNIYLFNDGTYTIDGNLLVGDDTKAMGLYGGYSIDEDNVVRRHMINQPSELQFTSLDSLGITTSNSYATPENPMRFSGFNITSFGKKAMSISTSARIHLVKITQSKTHSPSTAIYLAGAKYTEKKAYVLSNLSINVSVNHQYGATGISLYHPVIDPSHDDPSTLPQNPTTLFTLKQSTMTVHNSHSSGNAEGLDLKGRLDTRITHNSLNISATSGKAQGLMLALVRPSQTQIDHNIISYATSTAGVGMRLGRLDGMTPTTQHTITIENNTLTGCAHTIAYPTCSGIEILNLQGGENIVRNNIIRTKGTLATATGATAFATNILTHNANVTLDHNLLADAAKSIEMKSSPDIPQFSYIHLTNNYIFTPSRDYARAIDASGTSLKSVTSNHIAQFDPGLQYAFYFLAKEDGGPCYVAGDLNGEEATSRLNDHALPCDVGAKYANVIGPLNIADVVNQEFPAPPILDTTTFSPPLIPLLDFKKPPTIDTTLDPKF